MSSLHAAVGVVAGGGLLGDSGAQHVPLHHPETSACELWTPRAAEGEAAGLDRPGAGVGGEPDLFDPSSGVFHPCPWQRHCGADGD